MIWCTLRKVSICVLSTYIIVTCYSAYKLLKSKHSIDFNRNIATTISRVEIESLKRHDVSRHLNNKSVTETYTWRKQPLLKNVDIWSKAAIGHYFWEHIFDGSLEQQSSMYSYGELTISSISFRFYTGPGIVPKSMFADTGNVVLIVNGRESSKILLAKRWLDYITERSAQFSNAIVVLLGSEQCNNTWLKKYMVTAGGPVKVAFVTYDSPDIDNRYFYQWPLGVATYRSFPVRPGAANSSSASRRRYRCNFLGTVYENSTRETLMSVIHRHGLLDSEECYVKTRNEWWPQETSQSMSDYVDVLRSSDLTLNPVGQNAECYRIYEAMACGSVPVVEDRVTSDTCGLIDGDSRRTILALLKRHLAPSFTSPTGTSCR